MSLPRYLLLSAAWLASAVLAQAPVPVTPIGVVMEVQGLVTVTDGRTGATVIKGAVINGGMRFVATSTGSATLRFHDDCEIRLRSGQALTVREDMDCPELVAAVTPFPGGALAQAGGLGIDRTLLIGAGLAAGALGVTRIPNRSISSN